MEYISVFLNTFQEAEEPAVGVATGIWVGRSGFRIPVVPNDDVFLLKNVQAGYGAFPASYSVGTRVLSRG